MPSCDWGASAEECGCRDCRETIKYRESIITTNPDRPKIDPKNELKEQEELLIHIQKECVELKEVVLSQAKEINKLKNLISFYKDNGLNLPRK